MKARPLVSGQLPVVRGRLSGGRHVGSRFAVLGFCCALALWSWPVGAANPLADVRQYVHNHQAEILQEFRELLSIPNVASDTVNIRRNAHKLVEMLELRGVKARLLEGEGPPVVFGELRVAGAKRTIAIYVHYDGQPVDASKWNNDPFSPTLRDPANGGAVLPFPKPGDRVDPEWRLFARSASDDKAPIIATLQALDALKASGHPLTANLKFFLEGEEEAGSTHLNKLVMQNRALLDADVWICADGPVHQTRRQSLYFGCRGVVSATVTVYGPDRPLHSGHYGNWAPNPAMRLAKLLASMKDDNGRVLIAGFYDGVEPLGEVEKKAIRDMPASDTELMREYGLAETEGRGRPLAELITEPSLNIDGLRSEYVGAEARTIIPAEATATIDMRLVKGIEPERQLARLIAHIKKQGYVVSEQEPSREMRLKYPLIARVASSQGYRASRTRMDLPIAREIISAVTRASGRPPVLIPMLGGSTPMAIFESATGLPQIGVPIVNHDNNQHGSNENLRLQNLWDGIEIFAAIMTMD